MFRKIKRFIKDLFKRRRKRKKLSLKIKAAGKKIENFENIWNALHKQWEIEGLPKKYKEFLGNWIEKEFKRRLRMQMIIQRDVKKALEEIMEAHWNKILSIKKAPEYIKWRLQLSYLEDLKEKIKSAEDEKMFLKAFELDEFIK